MSDHGIRVALPEPHDAQRIFLDSPAKRKIIRAGRRGGKTVGAAILAVRAFLAGRRVLYAAPVADQIQTFWRETRNALYSAIEAGYFSKNETERSITSGRGSQRIRAKTAWNADSLRGDYADLLILDEFQLMDEAAWEEVGAPMLLDNDGDAVFIYTPPSLHSRSVTKARDPRHAAKMFAAAAKDGDGRWLALHFTSLENPAISRGALEEVTRDMTRLAYRQEILAEDIDEIPGALWTRKIIENARDAPGGREYTRVVIGVDPSGSSTTEAGIVACGLDAEGVGYVIADASMLAPAPHAWASAAVALYDTLKADRILGERNFGGDMVRSTVHTVDSTVSYQDVTSSRGKIMRAEPVAAMFEIGRARIAGSFPELEDEMCSYVGGASRSPNRMDAMVFAMTNLLLGPKFGIRDYYRREADVAEAAMRRHGAAPPPWSNEDRAANTRDFWRRVWIERSIPQ